MKVIGITGTLGAGKGTVVEYLMNKHGYLHYSARGLLNEIIAERKLTPGRDSMRSVANGMRAEKGPAALIEALFAKAIVVGKDAIIESVRTEGEIIALRDSGSPFILMAVDANQKLRYDRAIGRGSSTDKVSFEKFCEQEAVEMKSTEPHEQNLSRCMELADVRLENNGSLEELHSKVEAYLTANIPAPTNKKRSGGVHKPWSKRHKKDFKGVTHSLSNSFAQPLRNEELVALSLARGDKDIVDMYHKHSLGYTPNGGSYDLRHEISKLYGPLISAENILVFGGAQVALQTAAIALASHCHSIVFTPGYQSVQDAPLMAGSKVTKIRLRPENGWQIQLEEVEAAIRDDTRYMVLNEPYNPTGILMSKELQLKLKELAQRHGITILCDEVYRLLEHDEGDRLPAMADLYEKGLSCVTLSKPWGGCGITIGWLALRDLQVRQQLVDVQYFNTACPSRASEIQAIMTLRASDTILRKNIEIIRRNKALLDRFFSDYPDLFQWCRPNAGAIAFVKFKGPLTSEELGDELAAAGIGIKPAYCFADELIAAGCHDYDDFFRIGFGEEKFPQALEALQVFVEEHKEGWGVANKKRRVSA